ncbi:MAG TPA: metal ABC transporter substrate-binding protein [Acidobacteriota bacterium]|nr:metal ABC transporter substrate-binding protein [Acidobacteriota bacterium]
MKITSLLMMIAMTAGAVGASASEPSRLNVVTTLPDYAYLAGRIGGDRVSVQMIVRGNQDAHFIRPKPSFVNMVRNADVLISTGLDLELWLPTVVDKSGNTHVRSGEAGYVAASHGMTLLEKPTVLSRSEGGVHIYGNPHVNPSPINMKVAARNIATGFLKNDPDGRGTYEANLKALLDEFDVRLFGAELVGILGGETLCRLTEKGALIAFLEEQTYEGRKLIEYLGGWMARMMPLRGKSIVTYHKNWAYFLHIFGIEEAGTVEPKPGIPPSARHVNELADRMRTRGIRIILAANYFDEQKIRTVAERVDAEPVIVPLYVGGGEGADDYFQLVDLWVNRLLAAAEKKGLVEVSTVSGDLP